MRNLKIFFIATLAFIGLIQRTYGQCNLNTPNDLLESFKTYHPQVIKNNSIVTTSKKLIEIAQERPNPEFQAEGIKGKEIDGDINRVSLSVMHTFEIGGKRSSRIDYAESKSKLVKASVQDVNEDVLIDAILKAYRLRQVKELIPIYQEAYGAFNKILKAKLKRRSLSPEQQVEKETLVLATNDYRLKVSKLKSEKINLSRHLSFYLGKDCVLKYETLPSNVDLTKKFDFKKETPHYSKLKVAMNNLESTKMKLELERSNAYPDLKFGPSFETESINGKSYQSIGLSLSMDLPIFNTNNGHRGQALKQINTAKLNLKNVKRESSLDLGAWIEKYNALGSSLKTIATRDDLEKKHLKIEKLFKRGVISTAMIIESHRQLIEFANTRYEFELGVAEALWNIYKINGTTFSEKL
jgi:outer membrane protein, heavy metal efflux system